MAHAQNIPIVKPDCVKGYMGNAQTKVDRYFYVVDEVTGLVYEWDGFLQPKEKPGEPDRWMLITICPACGQGLRIDTNKKPLQVTAHGLETGEPIACGYFLKDHDGYTGMCPFRAELQPFPPDKPEFADVTTEDGQRLRGRLDAKLRRAMR